MAKRYIGIDPGKSGGAAALDADGGTLLCWHRFKKIGSGMHERIDGRAYARWIDSVTGGVRPVDVCICVEAVGSWSTDSARASWAFGRALGTIEGASERAGFAMTYIRPQDWQKIMLRGKPRATKKARKESSRLVASDRYPELSEFLAIKANDGVADAANIAVAAMLLDRAIAGPTR